MVVEECRSSVFLGRLRDNDHLQLRLVGHMRICALVHQKFTQLNMLKVNRKLSFIVSTCSRNHWENFLHVIPNSQKSKRRQLEMLDHL
jgi:hypothetical protein